MKNKIKIYRIALLCLLSLAMGCSKDDYQIDQQRKEPSSKLSFEQFKNETGLRDFKTSIQVQRKKNGALSRNADGSYELSDFDIDTDVIKKLLVKQELSYTFMVRPKDKEGTPDTFYNLTVYYEKGNWETLIVALKPNDKSLADIKNGSIKDYEGTAQLVYNSRTWVNTGCVTVTLVTAVHCTCVGGSDDGSGCDGCTGGSLPCLEIQDFKFCDMMDTNSGVDYGGSPSGPSTPGTHTGGGGSGGDNTPTTNNDDDTLGDDGPVPPKHVYVDPNIMYDPTNDPCKTLKNLVDDNKANLKPEIQWLQTKAGLTKEFGVEVKKKMQSSGEAFDYPVERVESPSQFDVDLSYGESYIGSLHSHPIDSYAMFSFGDVRWLLGCYQSAFPSKQADVFTIVVCKDNNGNINTYALKVNDIEKLAAGVNAVWNNPDYADILDEKLRTKAINNAQSITYSKSGNQLEKSFLQQFGAFGIDLYKASNDLASWDKLKLSTTAPLEVKSTPCN